MLGASGRGPAAAAHAVRARRARGELGDVAVTAREFRAPRTQRGGDVAGVPPGGQALPALEGEDCVTLFGGAADHAPVQSTIGQTTKAAG